MVAFFSSLNVLHVNEEKSPFFFLLMILPEHLHNMYPTLYLRFVSPAYLIHPIGLLGFQDYHRKDALCKTVMPGLPNTDWADSGLFFQI